MTSTPQRPDIWKAAFESLSPDDKAILGDYRSDHEPKAFYDEIRKTLDKRETTKWRIQIRGRTVVVRDVLERISGWLKVFKDVGDIAVQVDSVHAAIPWAVFRFALQAVLNGVEKNSVIIEGVELVSQLVLWSEIQERQYLQEVFTARHKLIDAFQQLYESVLKFLSAVLRHFCRRSLERGIGNILTGKAAYAELLNDMRDGQAQIKSWSDQICRQGQIRSNETLESIRSDLEKLEGVEQGVAGLMSRSDEKRFDAILDWISPIKNDDHHEAAAEKLLGGTGQWLRHHPTYRAWNDDETPSGLFWLQGIMGSGKTSLLASCIDDMITDYNKGSGTCPIYFYCVRDPQEPERSDPKAILRCLLRQATRLLGGDIIHGDLDSWYDSRRGKRHIRCDDATRMIIKVLDERQITYIWLDALDECDRDAQHTLLTCLNRILGSVKTCVKIFLTSRAGPRIIEESGQCHSVTIMPKNNEAEIAAYTNRELQTPALSKHSSALQARIKEYIVSGAQGMFQWARLQLQYLCDLEHSDLVESRLGNQPPTLDGAYRDLYDQRMSRHLSELRSRARGVFQWLLCSQIRLSRGTFLELVTCHSVLREDSQYDPKHCMTVDGVLSMCFGLVVYDRQSDVFRFSHQSVREFFETSSLPLWDNALYKPWRNHEAVATTCLRMIFKSFPADLTVVRYAEFYWAEHMRLRSILNDGSESALESEELGAAFLGNKANTFEKWATNMEAFYEIVNAFEFPRIWIPDLHTAPFLNISHPLLLAAQWGFTGIVRQLIDRLDSATAAEVQTVDRLNCLHLALSRTHVTGSHAEREAWEHRQCDTLEILLDAEIDANSSDQFGMTALHVAVRHNNIRAARLLLARGAKPDGVGAKPGTLASTSMSASPLHDAAESGRSRLVELFSEDRRTAVNSTDAYGQTPLHLAARHGHNHTVKLLLNTGADANAQDFEGRTALHMALSATFRVGVPFQELSNGQKEVISQLLSLTDVDIHVRDQRGCTPLYLAALLGAEDIVDRLLAKGAVAKTADNNGHTALQKAASNGFIRLTEKLLAASTAVDHQDTDGETALLSATRQDHVGIVETLIQHGADANARNRNGWSALMLASRFGWGQTVRALLAGGADASVQDDQGRSAISLAQEFRNAGVVEILLAAQDLSGKVEAQAGATCT